MPTSQLTDANVTRWLETHNRGISPMVTRGRQGEVRFQRPGAEVCGHYVI